MAEGLAGLAQGLAQGTTYLNTAVSNRMQTEAQNKATDTRAALDRESLAAQKEEALANRQFRDVAFQRQKELDDRTYNLEADMAAVKKTVELGMLRNQDRSVTVAENQQETSAEMARKQSELDDKRLGLEVIKTEEGIRQGDEELDIRRAENRTRAAQVDKQFNAENQARMMDLVLKGRQLVQGDAQATREFEFMAKQHDETMKYYNRQNILNTMLTIDTAAGIPEPVKERMKRGTLRMMVLTGAIQDDVIESTNSPASLIGSSQALKSFNEAMTVAQQDFMKAVAEGKSEFPAYVEFLARMDIAANETSRLLKPNGPNRVKHEDVDGVVDELMKLYSTSGVDAAGSKPTTAPAPQKPSAIPMSSKRSWGGPGK